MKALINCRYFYFYFYLFKNILINILILIDSSKNSNLYVCILHNNNVVHCEKNKKIFSSWDTLCEIWKYMYNKLLVFSYIDKTTRKIKERPKCKINNFTRNYWFYYLCSKNKFSTLTFQKSKNLYTILGYHVITLE